jgi:hypothetical protein
MTAWVLFIGSLLWVMIELFGWLVAHDVEDYPNDDDM